MSALIDTLVSAELKKFLAPRERPSASAGAVRLHMGEAPNAPALDGLNVASLNRVPEKKPATLAARMAEVYGVAPANLAVTADSADAAANMGRIVSGNRWARQSGRYNPRSASATQSVPRAIGKAWRKSGR